MANDDRLLTVNEVAERLRLHPITVRRHIKAGKLRAVRVGRAVRVREADVDEYLGAETQGWVAPDLEAKGSLMREYYRALDRVHIELPYDWPPMLEEIERRKKATEEIDRLRAKAKPLAMTTAELVRQVRRERDEKHDRTSGLGGRRVSRGKMVSDRRDPYGER